MESMILEMLRWEQGRGVQALCWCVGMVGARGPHVGRGKGHDGAGRGAKAGLHIDQGDCAASNSHGSAYHVPDLVQHERLPRQHHLPGHTLAFTNNPPPYTLSSRQESQAWLLCR